MRAVGETFDGEKSLPYLFDSVVHLYRDDRGRFLGRCLKDRSERLPMEEFESSYAVFEKAFGIEELEREPGQVLATEDKKKRIHEHLERLGMEPEQVRSRLPPHLTLLGIAGATGCIRRAGEWLVEGPGQVSVITNSGTEVFAAGARFRLT